MPVGNEVGKFLFAIGEQKEGFSFGKPWRNSDNSLGLVIPILRTKQVKRDYKMIEETKKVHIEDTGSIDTATILNKDNQNVFIRSGSILSGSTQERAVVSGAIIMANSEEEITVKCVHASRGIRPGALFEVSEVDSPPSVYLALKEEDQGKVWNSVQNFSNHKMRSNRRMGFSGSDRIVGAAISSQSLAHGSDDLLSTIREVEKNKRQIESSLKDIPVVENQVGAIIFDQFGITGFEVFDSQESWKALHKKVLAKYSDVLMQEQEESIFELKPEVIPTKIAEFVELMMKSDERKTFENKVSSTFVIDGDRIIGEYTQLNGDIIHVIVFKRETPRTKNKSAKTRNYSPNDIVDELDQNSGIRVARLGRV